MAFLAPDGEHYETLAEAYARSRHLFPTDMSSEEVRMLDASVLRQSLFSSRTTDLRYLLQVEKNLSGLLAGQWNEAHARAELQAELDRLGYDPARGFPGDNPERIPPAEPGSLRDLSSDRRIELMLTTQERMASNYAFRREGQTDEALWQFPCYELVRIYVRRHERDDWEKRWAAAAKEAGDARAIEVYRSTGRMVARKDSGIWQALGDGAGGFADTLQNPYPPFAFGSGLGWDQLDRSESIRLGAIDDGEVPDPTDAEFASDLAENSARLDDKTLDDLEAELLKALNN